MQGISSPIASEVRCAHVPGHPLLFSPLHTSVTLFRLDTSIEWPKSATLRTSLPLVTVLATVRPSTRTTTALALPTRTLTMRPLSTGTPTSTSRMLVSV